MNFKNELIDLINRASIENDSNTPDFLLADYLIECLNIFGRITNSRDSWHNSDIKFMDKLDY